MLYPVLTSSRMISELNGIWEFKLDNGKAFEEKWYANPLEDSMTMCVPSSFNDLKEGVNFRDHYGWVFYQRKFTVPDFLKTQRIVLRLDSVVHKAKVYLNGELITEHKGGFLPFEVEITDKVKEENLLTVAANNEIDDTTLPVGKASGMLMGFGPASSGHNEPNFDFFNYGGILRPVRIYTTPKDYIKDISLVPSVNGNNAELLYTVETVGKGNVKIFVYDEEEKLVASGESSQGVLKIPNVHLWQPLNAYLYNVKVCFGEDIYNLPYGIRTVEIKNRQFLINGKAFYFKGYGKHEDTFPNGRGINEAMNVKDISLMKWQGANSFRTSHYPYSEEMMRLCDREGIVVIDETTAVGINLSFGGGANFGGSGIKTFDKEKGIKTAEHHKEVIRDLIARDKNHACVVIWSIANEPDSTSEGAYEYFKPLFDLAKELDPQKRPCTLVSVQNNPVQDVTVKLSDIICLNRYYGWYFGGPNIEFGEEKLREEMKYWASVKQPVMFTEFGADTIMGFHDTTPVMYTEEYQVEYYKSNCKVLDECAFVVGEQVWNFADFATSQGLLRIQGNKKGIFTRDRKPKLIAHWFKERWNNIPDFDYKK